jgi:hypothetical protein
LREEDFNAKGATIFKRAVETPPSLPTAALVKIVAIIALNAPLPLGEDMKPWLLAA